MEKKRFYIDTDDIADFNERLEWHLKMSIKAWHDWNNELPMFVEVICKEIAKRYGNFLSVKRWLIIQQNSGLKECLVAEFDIMTSHFGKIEPLQLHINHLVPAVMSLDS